MVRKLRSSQLLNRSQSGKDTPGLTPQVTDLKAILNFKIWLKSTHSRPKNEAQSSRLSAVAEQTGRWPYWHPAQRFIKSQRRNVQPLIYLNCCVNNQRPSGSSVSKERNSASPFVPEQSGPLISSCFLHVAFSFPWSAAHTADLIRNTWSVIFHLLDLLYLLSHKHNRDKKWRGTKSKTWATSRTVCPKPSVLEWDVYGVKMHWIQEKSGAGKTRTKHRNSKTTEVPRMALLQNLESNWKSTLPSSSVISTYLFHLESNASRGCQHRSSTTRTPLLLPAQTASMDDTAESPSVSNTAHRSTQANTTPISHKPANTQHSTNRISASPRQFWALLSANLCYSLGFRRTSSPHCSTVLEISLTHGVLTSVWCISLSGGQTWLFQWLTELCSPNSSAHSLTQISTL